MTKNQSFYVQHFSEIFHQRKGRKVIKTFNESLYHLDSACSPALVKQKFAKINQLNAKY